MGQSHRHPPTAWSFPSSRHLRGFCAPCRVSEGPGNAHSTATLPTPLTFWGVFLAMLCPSPRAETPGVSCKRPAGRRPWRNPSPWQGAGAQQPLDECVSQQTDEHRAQLAGSRSESTCSCRPRCSGAARWPPGSPSSCPRSGAPRGEGPDTPGSRLSCSPSPSWGRGRGLLRSGPGCSPEKPEVVTVRNVTKAACPGLVRPSLALPRGAGALEGNSQTQGGPRPLTPVALLPDS